MDMIYDCEDRYHRDKTNKKVCPQPTDPTFEIQEKVFAVQKNTNNHFQNYRKGWYFSEFVTF